MHGNGVAADTNDGTEMRWYTTTARVAGVLYIIATVAIIASGPFAGSTDSLDFLTDVAAEEQQVMAGTLLQLAWVLSVMFIPVVLYPVLRLHSGTGALGFFSLRFTEALLSMVDVVIQLTMLSLIVRGFDANAIADLSAETAEAA